LRWREQDGVRWLEAELPGATAAFSTRVGGVSGEPYASLNLAILTGDEVGHVRENRHRLAGALGLDPGGVLIGRQVHGAQVARREEPPEPNAYAEPGPSLPEVDGQATSAPGLAPLVFVADCLPVALTGPGGVAMVHCGWRGMAAGIVERGVGEAGATAAAIGPGIGPCCYEVGDEVLEAFESLGPGIADGRMLDLREVARRLLERAGVERIESSDLCTSCNPELFFSHRRDGERTGRQAGLVWKQE
jgi:purine-nucleoside/S-methyl-5'-thioadenosine phosphorylase / adenosine deaminase